MVVGAAPQRPGSRAHSGIEISGGSLAQVREGQRQDRTILAKWILHRLVDRPRRSPKVLLADSLAIGRESSAAQTPDEEILVQEPKQRARVLLIDDKFSVLDQLGLVQALRLDLLTQ